MYANPNPFKALLLSRKFWLTILDLVVSGVLFFGGKYMGASAFEDVKWAIAAIQPVFVVIIGAIAYEDAARARS